MRGFEVGTWQRLVVGFATLGLACAVGVWPAEAANQSTSDRLVELGTFDGRLAFQPDGPFAVVVFREDALGNHIGVMYWGVMGDPATGKWALADRFWQAEEWSTDVTAFAWSPGMKSLYVATSGIYGAGVVYRLDLLNRFAQRVFPSVADLEKCKGQEISSTILSVDAPRRVLVLKFESPGLPKPMVQEIPFE